MIEIAQAFRCVPPLGWNESRKKGSIVFKRPERELAVSAWGVQEKKSKKKIAVQLESLLQDTLKEMEKDAKNPNLLPDIERMQTQENGLDFWVQSFLTRDTTMLICSAIVKGPAAVLLATLSAPNRPESFPTFVEFLRSIQPLSES